MKKYVLLLVIAVFSLSIISSKVFAQEKLVIKLGHGGAVTDPRQAASLTFKRVVEELTNGEVEVQIYPAYALGSWSEMLEGLQMNSVQVLIEDMGTLQNFSPICGLGFMPGIYTDKEHFLKVWNSEVGAKIFDMIKKESGYLLKGIMYRGARNLTANKPIKTLNDLEGLKIRVTNAQVSLDSWTAWGASPQAMAFPEVFGALQQGVIDAQENPIEVIYNDSIYEVAPYITFTEHIYSAMSFIMWDETYESWPENVRMAIDEAAKIAGEEYTEGVEKREAKIISEWEKNPKVTLITLDPKEKEKWMEIIKDKVHSAYPNLNDVLKMIDSKK